MLEMVLMMVAFLYSAFFSLNWLWAFPAALAVMAIKHYLKGTKKK